VTDAAHTRREMRLDRFASLWIFHPLARVRRESLRSRVPILMYHGVREGTSAVHPYYETSTSPLIFAGHMNYLHAKGYKVLDLGAAICSMGSGTTNEKRAVITFDDGYRDFYRNAYPTLKKFGFTATVFLPTGFISEPRTTSQGKEYMTWSEVRELAAEGIRFGSHTVTHPQLTNLSEQSVQKELHDSKKTIEDELGSAVTSFAYPFAFPQSDAAFVRSLRNLLETEGYEDGVCTAIGTASNEDDRLFLPRLPVNSYDDLSLFQAKLEAGYDWLRGPQNLSSMAKRLHRPRGGQAPATS